MLQLWGRLSSINVRKVVWCLQELGLPFQRTDAGGRFGVVATPAYRALNPNALVPVLEDDDDSAGGRFHLWESNVIVRYLCARHSSGDLYPDLLSARFDAERWMDWQQTTLNPAGRDAFIQYVRTPAGQRDATVAARSVQATDDVRQDCAHRAVIESFLTILRDSTTKDFLMHQHRRSFLMTVAGTGAALIGARSLAQAKLDEKDAQAQALGYVADATKADVKKYPKYAAGQRCSTCALYQGKPTDAAGPCPLFGGKQVLAGAWCSAWAKKA